MSARTRIKSLDEVAIRREVFELGNSNPRSAEVCLFIRNRKSAMPVKFHRGTWKPEYSKPSRKLADDEMVKSIDTMKQPLSLHLVFLFFLNSLSRSFKQALM